MSGGELTGKRVVVTQAVHQAPELRDLLRRTGAEPLLYPCIAIEPPADPAELDASLLAAVAGSYDWLVVTSANTALVLGQRLAALGVPDGALARLAVAAVGPATADAVRVNLGVAVSLVPDEHVAEGLAAALLAVLAPGQRVLLPQADLARPVLARELAAGGLAVTSVVAYRTTVGSGGVQLAACLANKEVDAILLTSASTARNLVLRLQAEGGDLPLLNGVCIACIGPVTAAAAREAGLAVGVVAATQSLEGLVDALATVYF
jgi:uroporphyrinogen-III synthase/uroporphyrinogen III methyltransferase/synthase